MTKDIFGSLLSDYYQGKDVFEITERDDGFISATPIKRYFEEYINWSIPEKEGIKYTKGKVLDIGCGAGRHSLFLQRNNQKVLSIDNSSLALEVSSKRGVLNTKNLNLFDIDDLKECFDSHIMMGNNLGLLGDPNNLVNFLRALYKKTKKNGLALLGNRNPYLTDKEIHKNYLIKNKEKGNYPGKLRIKLRYKEIESDWFFFLLLSPEELRDLVKKTRWDWIKVFGKNKKDYVVLLKKN